jgi:5-methylcytosine-specific restriction endonuclease McrA
MRRYHSDPEFRSLSISRAENRRVRNLGLEGIASPASLVTFLMDRDQGVCGICRKAVTETTGPWRPSIDHIVPLAHGGLHVEENLQLAHYRCNLSKGARVEIVFEDGHA